MSVKQRENGMWRARYRDANGREHAQHFKRKTDADTWERNQRAEVDKGTWTDPRKARRKFGDYAEEWLAAQIHHRKSTTVGTESRLKTHILPKFKDRPLGAITRSEVRGWVAERSAKLSPSTMEGVYRLLAQIMASAVEDRLLRESPCRRIALPANDRPKIVPPTLEQVTAIAGKMTPRYRAAVWLAATTGTRLGETLGVTVDRVNWLRREVTVDRQLDRSGRFAPLKTRASRRTIPVADFTTKLLAAHLEEFPAGPGGVIFTTTKGTAVAQPTFGDPWRKAAGGVRFHDLRHHYASLLIANGVSVKVVQERLGHANARETLDTYSHLWPDDEDRTRQAVAAIYESAIQSARPRENKGRGGT